MATFRTLVQDRDIENSPRARFGDMPQFTYAARTRGGERVEGALDAPDQRKALTKLEHMGYVPIKVSQGSPPKREQPSEKGNGAQRPTGRLGGVRGRRKAVVKPKRGPRHKQSRQEKEAQAAKEAFKLPWQKVVMKPREILLFTRELSDLLASGMTLGKALNTLSNRKTGNMQDQIVVGLRDEIVNGASLSVALGKYPESFSPLFVNMVRAGEASGTLPDVLERLGEHFERVQDAKEKVITALVYPAIILVVGLLTMAFIMVFVIPRFEKIFQELDAQLPGSTQLLIAMSGVLMKYWWAILFGIVGGTVFMRRTLRTPGGKRWWDGLLLRMPVVRGIVVSNAYGHFARTLGALLTNGVPVLSALSIVEETMTNQVIADEIHSARDKVTDGATISAPLEAGKVFPRLLTDMLKVGEESGDMSGALGHIANRYDKELDRNVKIFTTVLEPIMILLMATLVGFVAISMLMAVFDMTSGLNV